jgi:hypothetical protein
MKILIKFSSGFGTKVFNAIIGLYIAHITGGELIGYIGPAKHDKQDKYSIYEVFQELLNYYTFMSGSDTAIYKNSENKIELSCKDMQSLNDFKEYSKYDIIVARIIDSCYKFVYDMYKILPIEMKNVFKINESIISQKIKDITKTEKYICVHVRYGDKLQIALSKQRFLFLIYTPDFYKRIIKKFLDKQYKVYIVTDDKNITKKFVVDELNNSNVEMLNTPSWDDYYLLSHSYYNVLSLSTFSISASLINKNLKGAYIVKRPNDINQYSIPEEELIDKFPWTKFYNKKYILNYDNNLMKKMLSYK